MVQFRLLLLCSVIFLSIYSYTSAHEAVSPNEVTINMFDDHYEPSEVTIQHGTKVTFLNAGENDHWPASNIHPSHRGYPGTSIRDCNTNIATTMFDACSEVAPGESFSFTFNEPGRWKYHDHLKADISGVVIVEGDDVPVATPAPETMIERLKQWLLSWYRSIKSLWLRRDLNLDEIAVYGHTDDEELLRTLIETFGGAAVMNKLLTETQGGAEFDCHQEAHDIGRIAYQVSGTKVFGEGDAACHSGFYHGAMESLLVEEGAANLMNKVTEICSEFPNRFGVFECLHGVGHGVLAYEGYDLPAALDVCDQLPDSWSASSCYGGVFMENIITAQGYGADDAHSTDWVSTEDLHFPCSDPSVTGTRDTECYKMQTSWMLFALNYDFPAVIAECENSPEEFRSLCFLSVGRDAAGYTLRDPEQILPICSLVPTTDGYNKDCIYGALNVIIDFWGPKLDHQADEFCAVVEDEAIKTFCEITILKRRQELFSE